MTSKKSKGKSNSKSNGKSNNKYRGLYASAADARPSVEMTEIIGGPSEAQIPSGNDKQEGEEMKSGRV